MPHRLSGHSTFWKGLTLPVSLSITHPEVLYSTPADRNQPSRRRRSKLAALPRVYCILNSRILRLANLYRHLYNSLSHAAVVDSNPLEYYKCRGMPHHEDYDFSAAPEVHDFSALFFDMDGTIIDSTAAIVKYWMALGKEIGVPGETILETSHGRRSIDVLGLLAPDKANWDYVCKAEGQVPINYGKDAVEVPGSRALLEKLQAVGAAWAIVTSGTRPLVTGWLDVMGLAHPEYLVTAEEVVKGKPDPACYRLGAKRLGFSDESGGVQGEIEEGKHVDPSQFLVLEDAPAGVRAGKAAGYKVVAVATTHAIPKLRAAGADWVVRDMRSVTLANWDSKASRATVEIRDALVT